jgi:hypothetical protein
MKPIKHHGPISERDLGGHLGAFAPAAAQSTTRSIGGPRWRSSRWCQSSWINPPGSTPAATPLRNALESRSTWATSAGASKKMS